MIMIPNGAKRSFNREYKLEVLELATLVARADPSLSESWVCPKVKSAPGRGSSYKPEIKHFQAQDTRQRPKPKCGVWREEARPCGRKLYGEGISCYPTRFPIPSYDLGTQ